LTPFVLTILNNSGLDIVINSVNGFVFGLWNNKMSTMEHLIAKNISICNITHDVLQIFTEKPQHLNFTPGQAIEIFINTEGWQNENRLFTFTSLPNEDYLQFTLKTYPAHKGVTNELLQLKKNDEFILHDVFGAIAFKNEAVFIAGGAGVTPFISILRYLKSKNEIGDNKLIFANKTRDDIILKYESNFSLGKNPGVHAALITDSFSAHQGVEDDEMNIMCLGGRVTGYALSWDLVQTFLIAPFLGDKRLIRRLEKIPEMEGNRSEL
jgi:predicted ferric reductase